MAEMEEDPIVAEVREIRARLNKEANYDLRELATKAAEFVQKVGFKISRLTPLRPHFS